MNRLSVIMILQKIKEVSVFINAIVNIIRIKRMMMGNYVQIMLTTFLKIKFPLCFKVLLCKL